MTSTFSTDMYRPLKRRWFGLPCNSTRFASRNFRFVALIALNALFLSSPNADHLFGSINGSPHHAVHPPFPRGVSTLSPDPVVSIHSGHCAWLPPALAVQGFDLDGSDNVLGTTDDWAISFSSLSKMSLEVELYGAYVDTNPALTCGTLNLAADTVHHTGGAEISLAYHPHAGDPMGSDVHWLQVIKTNRPSSGAKKNDTAFFPFSVYLDNVGNPLGNPFYDFQYAANSEAFADIPRRPFQPPPSFVTWKAQVFLTTGDLAAHKLTIYDGAWWGFQLSVPEPHTITLFGAGAFVLLGFYWQHRRKTL